MLVSTEGIVIHNTAYSESSVISKVFLKNYGMQSCITSGVHSAKAVVKPSHLQPLTMLDVVLYFNPAKEIHRIKEARISEPLRHLHYHIKTTPVCMFVSEVVFKTVKEHEPNENLFSFLKNFILFTDKHPECAAQMLLYFMVHFTSVLGFFPHNNFSEDYYPYFNMYEGNFVAAPNPNAYTLDNEISFSLAKIITADLENTPSLNFSAALRNQLTEKLISYYELHIPGFSKPKSYYVLKEVMHG